MISISLNVILKLSGMNNLEIFSKLKRRNGSLLTEPRERLYKNRSEFKKLSPFSKLEQVNQIPSSESSKIIPKNILYDKQSLYLEVLSLKVELNQVMDENLKLKTKIITLENQLQQANKRQIAEDKMTNYRQKINKNEKNKANDVFFLPKQNPFVEGLKKMLKETKRQAESLKNQNIKMKKSSKISRVNELQIENEIVIQQNLKLSIVNSELLKKIQNAQTLQQKNRHLERNKFILTSEIKSLEQEISTLQFYIKTIQIDRKYEANKPHVKERKRYNYSNLDRPNDQNALKRFQLLRKQFLHNKQLSFRINKRQKLIKLHQNILPIRREPITSMPVKQAKQKGREVKQEQNLTKSNQEVEEDGNIIGNFPQNNLSLNENMHLVQEKQMEQKYNEDKTIFQNESTQKLQKSQQIQKQYNSVQGQEHKLLKIPQKKQQFPTKAFSQPESHKLKSKEMFKSNIRQINQICQLLTYRLMAQKYTFNELKVDIEQSESKQFSYIDLCHMFVNEPFFLTVQYCKAMLCFTFEKEKPNRNDAVTSITLIAKLRKVVKDFECTSEEQQRRMTQRCVKIITEQDKQIKQACNQVVKQVGFISHDNLKSILKRFSLSETEVTMIIGQLSICSESLNNLNLEVLFQRFNLNQLSSEQRQNNIIQQQQNDDSFINKSKHKEEERLLHPENIKSTLKIQETKDQGRRSVPNAQRYKY